MITQEFGVALFRDQFQTGGRIGSVTNDVTEAVDAIGASFLNIFEYCL